MGGVGGSTTLSTGSAVSVSRERFHSEVRVAVAAYNNSSGLPATIGHSPNSIHAILLSRDVCRLFQGRCQAPKPADVSIASCRVTPALRVLMRDLIIGRPSQNAKLNESTFRKIIDEPLLLYYSRLVLVRQSWPTSLTTLRRRQNVVIVVISAALRAFHAVEARRAGRPRNCCQAPVLNATSLTVTSRCHCHDRKFAKMGK